MIIHPGGAPPWFVRQWLELLGNKQGLVQDQAKQESLEELPFLKLIGEDLTKISQGSASPEDLVVELLDVAEPDAEADSGDDYPY